ncbi:MAG: HlyD family secretion protein [Rhizobiaceae bacterium]|nr:HlyD family secretion protein [Rhizobiaceae bacterium]
MNAVSKIEKDGEPVAADLSKPTAPVAPLAVQPTPVQPTPVAGKKRRGGRFLLMLAVPLLLAAGGSYYWVTGGRYEETENANLRQARVTVASEVAGRVVSTKVAENLTVHAGEMMFEIDPQPYRIALAQADAAVAAARLNVAQLRAAFSRAKAQEQMAAGDVAYFQSEQARQEELTGKGVGTRAALDSARRDLNKARDEQATATQSVAGALAALGGDAAIETDRHPAVLAALAARDKAAFDLSQTTVRAPADGVIAQASSFKTGQYVTTGTALFSLVETQESWVDANFKETQLTHVKPGQRAEIVLDTFPDTPLAATVEAIGAGTGAEFSLLPAQNATGNWVKVTQRIPVRLKVETADAELALRTGMSATVSIDTGRARGIPAFGGLTEKVAGLLGTAQAAE